MKEEKPFLYFFWYSQTQNFARATLLGEQATPQIKPTLLVLFLKKLQFEISQDISKLK